MKKILLVLLFCLMPVFCFGANAIIDESTSSYISVDTDPGADYSSTSVNVGLFYKTDFICFVLKGATYSAIVTLEYQKVGDSTWTVYDTYTSNTRLEIHDRSEGYLWRVTCINTEYTSGAFIAGIDWRRDKRTI